MQFLIIVKASRESEAARLPPREVHEAMRRYNDEMDEAGILMAAEGLHPSSKGARIRFQGGERIVTDGPFAETKELVAGFWMVEVASREEAVEWATRAPMEDGAELEVRQVYLAAEVEKMLAERSRETEVPARK